MYNDNSKTTTTWNSNNNNNRGGHVILHVSQIWALQHSAIYVDSYLLLLLLLFLIVHLPLCIHNNRWRTRKLHNNNNNNIRIHLQKLFHIFGWFIFMMIIAMWSFCCCWNSCVVTQAQGQLQDILSEGTPHLKMWTHFKIYSCFTEGLFVLHTKDPITFARYPLN